MTKKAAVIKGDGTGPELVNAMLHVLKECNTQIELVLCEAGSEQWEKHGGQTYIPVLQFRPDKNLSCMQM
jgi:isocitrate dehydrogenase